MVLVVREYVTAYTISRIIEDERHDTLRDTLIMICVYFVPLNGPSCVVETDCASSFQALGDDPPLKKIQHGD